MSRANRTGRKATERLRPQVEDYLEALIEGFVVYDGQWRMTYMNAAAEQMLGRRRAELLGRTWHEAFPHAVGNPVDRLYQRVMHSRRPEHMEFDYREPYGKWFEISASPVRGAGISVHFRDVSRRHQAESERRQAEEQLALVTDNMPALISYIDSQYRYRFANRQYEHWFRRAREEVLGRTMAEVLGDAAFALLRPRVDAALRGEPVRFESETPYREGGTRWIDAQYVPDRGPDGAVRGLFVLVLDITERKRTEERLRLSEQRLRMALEAGRMGTWEWDVRAGRVEWSEALEALHGLQPGTFPGTFEAFRSDIHPDDRAGVEAAVAQSMRGSDHHVEYRIVRPDGTMRWVEGRGKVFRDEAGAPLRMVGVCADVTERKEAESALHEADRRKDEFLATLAHELRNPLAPIRNAVQVLMAKASPDPDAAAARRIIDRQARQMARLLDDLLDVNRISRGLIELRRSRVTLAALLESAVETSRPLIEAAGHRLRIELPGVPVVVDADPVRLAQVLSNLLTNAARYTPEGGTIAVTVERRDALAEISVRDTGIGIAPEMLPRVFEMFSQAEPARERSRGGLGIGLALAKGLVELHGGTIEGRSAGAGQGAEFVVRLPLAADAEARGAQESGRLPRAARARRVLVVDDLKDSADSLASLIAIYGHEVRAAYDADSALALARELEPDIILLDLGMPKRNGYDACRELREQPWGRNARIVALTGWGQEEDQRRTREAGFDAHLVKPADPDALLKLLER